MGKVLRKLQSNSGATLILALLFFVVCAVTGSMILVSASAAVGRIENLKQRDQNYYAVRSAIKMYENQMIVLNTLNVTFSDELEVTETDIETKKKGASSSHNESYKYTMDFTDFERYLSENDILKWIFDKTISNYESKKTSPKNERTGFDLDCFKTVEGDKNSLSFELKNQDIPVSSYLSDVPGSDALNIMMDVDLKVYSQKNRSGVLKCRIYNKDSDSKEKYYMTLTADFNISCIPSVDGGDPDEDKVVDEYGNETTTTTTITTYTNTYTVHFKIRSITKG